MVRGPDDAGRPFLLSTELIQELRLGGQSANPAPPLVQEAVTLGATATSDGTPTLTAWFHLGQPVSLPSAITVTDDSGVSQSFTVSSGPSSPAFSEESALSPPAGYTVADGAQLVAQFPGDQCARR